VGSEFTESFWQLQELTTKHIHVRDKLAGVSQEACVHDGRGLAQFFGGGWSKAGEEIDAENLCLTPSNRERPSNSVNGYPKRCVER